MTGKSGYYWMCCGSEDPVHHREGCETMLDSWKFRTWTQKPFENQEQLKINSDIVAWVDTVWINRPDLANKIGIENMFQRHASGVKNYIPLYANPLHLEDEYIIKVLRKRGYTITKELK